ncbi:MAG: hypothetical protein AB7S49_03080 [Arcobacter sp.]|jgi:ribosome biogenesis protein Nip4|uniref:hypothetical protein n=1 Tax=unclassified Arcobacter TaxID=2593671 RepID=UPI00022966B1|nr:MULTISPECIES: hypothetical protein [unclassified Arcobacter]MDY3200040.1 hypothetical protein [Arcobacter sp.]BAK74591.1 conserved hypothetical protein [Arcobacter sp. L]
MIFIGLFLLIAIVVISLNIHNHSNLHKIEEYLKNSDCNNYVYSRGSYKALCQDYLIDVSNSFIVDIEKNSEIIKYENIEKLEVKELKIFINNHILEFADKNDLNLFYEKLKEKLNK